MRCPRRNSQISLSFIACALLAVPILLALLSCTPESLTNLLSPLNDVGFLDANTARLQGGAARDPIGVGFINRTPYRAIGTFGGYDPQDQQTIVTMGQLGVTENLGVEPNGVGVAWALPCTRAVSVGGRELLRLIYKNNLESTATAFRFFPSTTATLQFIPSLDLLKEDIGFTGAPFGDPQGSIPTEGTAHPVIKLLGSDYIRQDLLIFTFVQDPAAAGGFRIDFTTADALGVDTQRFVQLSQVDRALALAPLNLDRLTFEFLMAMGLPPQPAPLLAIQPGNTPGKVEFTINNQKTGAVAVAFFGPDHPVVQVISGAQQMVLLSPGDYEYLIAPPVTSTLPILGQQTFQGGFGYILSLF
jgi:hypothetical protein